MDDTLSVAQVATRCRWTKRTAQRFVGAWFDAQHLPAAPRVTRPRRPGQRGRRPFAVDAASLERWLLHVPAGDAANEHTAASKAA